MASLVLPNGSNGIGSCAGPCAVAAAIASHQTATAAVKATIIARWALIERHSFCARGGRPTPSLLLLLRKPGGTGLDLGEIVCLVQIGEVHPYVIHLVDRPI